MESAVATVLVAVIGLIGIIIQTKSHNKLKNQETLITDIDNKIDKIKQEFKNDIATTNEKIDKLREESKEDDTKLNAKVDTLEMEVCKRYLVVEMTKIKDGIYIPSEETKRVIHETKELYNKRGRR